MIVQKISLIFLISFLGFSQYQISYSQIDDFHFCLEECEKYEKTRSFIAYSIWALISIGLGIFGFKLIKSKNLKKYQKVIFYSFTVGGSFLMGFFGTIMIYFLIPPWGA